MENVAALACIRCQVIYPVSEIESGCRQCADVAPANLRVVYKPEVRKRWNLAVGAHDGLGMWRYAERLPLPASAAISLGEGDTPLIAASRIAARLGLERLFIKDESRNPTCRTRIG